MPYCIAGVPFPSQSAVKAHIRAVRDACPMGEPIEDPVVLALLRQHPQWAEKSAGMTAVSTWYINPHPAVPKRKEIVLLRGDQEPMDISWSKLVPRLTKTGELKHPSKAEEHLAELRIAARLEVEDQLAPRRAKGFHLDHAAPNTFEQLLFDWLQSTGLQLLQIGIESTHGTTVLRTFTDRALAHSWQTYHQDRAELILRTPAEHAKQPRIRVDWGDYLSCP